MKKITNTMEFLYKAKDGSLWETEEDCLNYEENILEFSSKMRIVEQQLFDDEWCESHIPEVGDYDYDYFMDIVTSDNAHIIPIENIKQLEQVTSFYDCDDQPYKIDSAINFLAKAGSEDNISRYFPMFVIIMDQDDDGYRYLEGTGMIDQDILIVPATLFDEYFPEMKGYYIVMKKFEKILKRHNLSLEEIFSK